MAGRGSPSLKPIATRPGDAEMGHGTPASSSGVLTPKGRGGGDNGSDSPGGMGGSDSSSPWRRFFRGGRANSEADSFANSPRNFMGFSPRAGSARTESVASPRRGRLGGGGGGGGRNGGGGGGGGDYGGQINAYPSTNPGPRGAAGAMMMSLAEELLTKKGLSLKDLQEDQEEYAETGDKVRCCGWWLLWVAAGAAVGGCWRCCGLPCCLLNG